MLQASIYNPKVLDNMEVASSYPQLLLVILSNQTKVQNNSNRLDPNTPPPWKNRGKKKKPEKREKKHKVYGSFLAP